MPANPSSRTGRARSRSDAGSGKVEHPRPRLEPLRALDLERIRECALEGLLRVVVVGTLAFARKQSRRHRVRRSWKLDHHLRAELAKPAQKLSYGDIRADHDMVDERQAERQVWHAALGQGLSLPTTPPETRRRVGDVHDKGQDRARPLVAERSIESVD